MNKPQKRIEIVCAPVSAGMGMGSIYVYRDIDLAALETKRFAIENIEHEIERLESAVAKSKEQLIDIRSAQTEARRGEAEAIFDVQLALLEDADFLAEIRSLLDEHRLNLEHLIASKIRQINKDFANLGDDLVKSRISDIHDTYHRILRNLLEIDYVRTRTLQRITSEVVLVSERLLPSDLALLDTSCLLGVALEEVSSLSHVAIMLRSMGVPAVGNTIGITAIARQGENALIDAERGALIVGPNAADLTRYEQWKTQSRHKATSSQHSSGDHETKDGVHLALEANAGSLPEISEAMRLGADGIGLLRSEIYYMSKTERPTVEEEAGFYREALRITGRYPLIVRLLDISAEKRVPYLPLPPEPNPQLGIRGVRYLFIHPRLLEAQIDAIVSVAEAKNIGILVPFVTVPADMDRILALVSERLEVFGKKRDDVRIGMMAEVPAAALGIAAYLDRIDFVSIGTNDLIQYLFAAGREERLLDPYRQAVSPVMLRIIHSIVMACDKAGKEVRVCGDMASEPFPALLMVGMGVRALSMPPPAIDAVDRALRNVPLPVLNELARRAMAAPGEKEVLALRKALSL